MDKTYVFGNDGYGNGCNGGWNNGIVDIAALALIAGGGFGGWGGRGGYGGGYGGATFGAVETANVNDHIDSAMIEQKVCDVQADIAEVKYADALNSKDNLRAMDQNSFALQSQIAECCCNTNRSIDQVRFDATLSNCQQNNLLLSEFGKVNANIDKLRCDAEIAALKERIRIQDGILFQASQENQTQRIISALSATATT